MVMTSEISAHSFDVELGCLSRQKLATPIGEQKRHAIPSAAGFLNCHYACLQHYRHRQRCGSSAKTCSKVSGTCWLFHTLCRDLPLHHRPAFDLGVKATRLIDWQDEGGADEDCGQSKNLAMLASGIFQEKKLTPKNDLK